LLTVLFVLSLAGCSFDADQLRHGSRRDAESPAERSSLETELPPNTSSADGPVAPVDAVPDAALVQGDVVALDSAAVDVAVEAGPSDATQPEQEAGSKDDASTDDVMIDLRGAAEDGAVTDNGAPDAAPENGGGAGGSGGTDADVPAPDVAAPASDAASDGGSSPVPGFAYTPTNFDPSSLDPAHAGSTIRLNCGVSTFDSSTDAFDNWCGPMPAVVKQSQAGGPDVVILALPSFTVAAGSTLRLTGAYPAVLAVFGDATIAGTIDASANGTTPGAGGNLECRASQGADGNGSPTRYSGASGGGGGAFSTIGGNSGIADTDNSDGVNTAASGGKVRGDAALSPLMGGCAGGRAGGCPTDGGAGGGAVQLSAAGALTLTGIIRANGADGSLPCGPSDEGGGTGGGSGGGVLLEATIVSRSGATLSVNGGSGGPDGAFFHCGGTVGGMGSTDPAKPGANGVSCVAGSSGGGGGYGLISVVNHH
jgi:hypothetical protein